MSLKPTWNYTGKKKKCEFCFLNYVSDDTTKSKNSQIKHLPFQFSLAYLAS